jgi:hypothetical protein
MHAGRQVDRGSKTNFGRVWAAATDLVSVEKKGKEADQAIR